MAIAARDRGRSRCIRGGRRISAAKRKVTRPRRPGSAGRSRVALRGGFLQRLDVTDPFVAALDLTKPEDFRLALSRLCGIDLVTACLRGPGIPCGSCPNCIAASQVPRLATPWTQGKLNQALVLYRRPTISEAFFDAFFPPGATNPELLAGVSQFRAYAMLRFGGFRSAFTRLAEADRPGIEALLREFNRNPVMVRAGYADRTHGQDLIDDTAIPIGDRWYLGYISDASLLRDFAKEEALRWRVTGTRAPSSPATQRYRATPSGASRYEKDVATYYRGINRTQMRAWPVAKLDAKRKELERMAEQRASAVRTAEQNSAAYLAASHIDVYVATSMRESWEFEAMGRVVKEIFEHPAVGGLALSKFDPTLSYYESRYDKGLVEGLMLHRADVTIYMVQETDTLGKDSELAATLAYGKPVIAYVPRYTRAQLVAELRRSPLRRTFTRMLMLLAENRIRPGSMGARRGLDLMRRFEPVFVLDRAEQQAFRTRHAAALDAVYQTVADAEIASLNSRAETIAERHPLGLQLQQGSGVAYGILLARTPARCATLLAQLLTNELQLQVVEEEHGTLLIESADPATKATFRVVTKDPVLTNAFWAHYRTFDREPTSV